MRRRYIAGGAKIISNRSTRERLNVMTMSENSSIYLELVKRFELRPIRDVKTLDRASYLFSELALNKNRSHDENDYLSVLGCLIREYEEIRYTPKSSLSSRGMLKHLMEENRLSQTDLAKALEIPQSQISEFLAGKRGLSKKVILKLSERFKVKPDAFLDK